MADDQIFDSLEREEQFWELLDSTLAKQCPTHEEIDDALRTWLCLAARLRDHFLESEDDIAACSHKLLASELFARHSDYVRTQIIYSLLQEDEEAGPLHVIASFLLLDGRAHEPTFRRMIDEACFPRLLELIAGARPGSSGSGGTCEVPQAVDDRRLHRLLLHLMYEMSRMERLRPEDLMMIDDGFVAYLFGIIEGASDDVNDPYHYPIIRVLLVLNEQYMLASTDVAVDPMSPSTPLTNRVIKLLSFQGPLYRTFGENIILLLNRETETSLQLLILKLLYLLFTTKATYEYFYTNDLRVLLDVIIRNLLDLPDEKMSLRHTYLRVLYPLLSHTQLSQPPHYKRDEISKVLRLLGGSGNAHFAPADETTVRLIERVSRVKWLEYVEQEQKSPVDEDQSKDEGAGPKSASADGDSPIDATAVARKFLGISLGGSQTASSVSVVDVAAVMERPGVKTPSRRAESDAADKDKAAETTNGAGAVQRPPPEVKPRRVLPEVPRHRHGVPYAHAHAHGHVHAHAAAPAAMATLHINGNGNGHPQVPVHKKMPPKAPPPRRPGRTRLATETSTGSVEST